jgi:hypothetical protein
MSRDGRRMRARKETGKELEKREEKGKKRETSSSLKSALLCESSADKGGNQAGRDCIVDA